MISYSLSVSGCEKGEQWEHALHSLQDAFEEEQLRDDAERRAGAERDQLQLRDHRMLRFGQPDGSR